MPPPMHSPKWWTHYLSNDEGEFTLEEYRAACEARGLGALVEIAQAIRHLEGMYGTLDDHLSKINPDYRQLSEGRARPEAKRLGEGERDGG